MGQEVGAAEKAWPDEPGPGGNAGLEVARAPEVVVGPEEEATEGPAGYAGPEKGLRAPNGAKRFWG